MIFGIPDPILSRLMKLFLEEKSVDRVILYGSRARGDARANSDIDIAIEGLNVPVGFKTKLREAAGLYKLDIVYLSVNPIDRELIDNIQKEGKLLFHRSSEEAASIQTFA